MSDESPAPPASLITHHSSLITAPGIPCETAELVHRPLPWRPIAIATTALSLVLALLLLPACCCRGRATAPLAAPEKIPPPLIGTQQIPTPTEAQSKAPVQAEMHNVW